MLLLAAASLVAVVGSVSFVAIRGAACPRLAPAPGERPPAGRPDDPALQCVKRDCASAALPLCGRLQPLCRVLVDLKCEPPSPDRDRTYEAVWYRLEAECGEWSAAQLALTRTREAVAICAAKVVLAATGGTDSPYDDAARAVADLGALAVASRRRSLFRLQNELSARLS